MPTSRLPTIASLWIGPRLSFLEQLCLKSFVDAGHPTRLYVYDEVGAIPEGVQITDASGIMPSDEFIVNAATGAPGPHSDRFRYLLMKATDEIWADTDAYCLRPFPDLDYVFARHFKNVVANGVLRLPKDSPTLAALLDFTATPYPDLPDDFPFLKAPFRAAYAERRGRMHVSEMPWEIWGPYAITYFLDRNDELRNALPTESLYPLAGGEIRRTLQMPRRANIRLPEDCLSIHFYGSSMRQLLSSRGGIPDPKSLLGQLCQKHGIVPSDAPVGRA